MCVCASTTATSRYNYYYSGFYSTLLLSLSLKSTLEPGTKFLSFPLIFLVAFIFIARLCLCVFKAVMWLFIECVCVLDNIKLMAKCKAHPHTLKQNVNFCAIINAFHFVWLAFRLCTYASSKCYVFILWQTHTHAHSHQIHRKPTSKARLDCAVKDPIWSRVKVPSMYDEFA